MESKAPLASCLASSPDPAERVCLAFCLPSFQACLVSSPTSSAVPVTFPAKFFVPDQTSPAALAVPSATEPATFFVPIKIKSY